MKRDTYLSIDLDYWCDDAGSSRINSFFDQLLNETKVQKLYLVSSHEMLLSHIDSCDCVDLINVDFHSDLADDAKCAEYIRPLKLNEGTWVNFVKWKNRKQFNWYHPHPNKFSLDFGYCHATINPFLDNKLANTGWKKVVKTKGHLKDGIPWNKVAAVGIAISYPWLLRGAQRHPFETVYSSVLPSLLGIKDIRKAETFAKQVKVRREIDLGLFEKRWNELASR